MSSSSIQLPVFQAKIGSIQNQADSSSVYSAGEWSFKNASAVTSVKIDNSGNVGIGTASPGHALDIQRPEANLRLSSTTLTNNAFTYYVNNGGTALIGLDNAVGTYGSPYALHINYQAAYPIIFSTNYVNRMTIDSSGNVGIGMAPFSVVALDVKEPDAGQDLILGLTAGTGARAQIRSIAQPDNTSSALSFATTSGGASGERMRIDASGNVTVSTGDLLVSGSTKLIGAVGSYNTTTASAANAHILSNGYILRSSSALKYKQDITPISHGLQTVLSMQPIEYKSKCEADKDAAHKFIGFVADWEETNLPALVQKNGEGEVEGFSYDRLTAVLCKAIQELSAKNEALEARLAALESK